MSSTFKGYYCQIHFIFQIKNTHVTDSCFSACNTRETWHTYSRLWKTGKWLCIDSFIYLFILWKKPLT